MIKNSCLSLHGNFCENYIHTSWKNLGTFRFEAPNLITYKLIEGSTPDLFADGLLGEILSLVLLHKNIFSLHASALCKNGRMYAFCGNSGAGKSTTAALLCNLGYELVTDDLLRIDRQEKGYIGWPSIQQINLWPQSLQHLKLEDKNLAKIYPGQE